MNHILTILFPIYHGVTHLDFTGPHQVFSRLPSAKVMVASVGGAPVTADSLTFSNLEDLTHFDRCDVLCVPGGLGFANAIRDELYLAAIKRLGAKATFVTSVCTGSLILGAAGLIAGKRAACHWAWRERLVDFGAIPDAARVVRDGNFLTGGGVTAGIDLALTLVAEMEGPLAAQTIQLALEYAPEPPFDAGRPETAPEEAIARVKSLAHSRKDELRKTVTFTTKFTSAVLAEDVPARKS